MKLEFKENMYIRTCDGIIDKVIIDYNGHCASPNCEYKHISCAKNYYDEDKVVKASYNIIDLIEVGDYVNGHRVILVNDTFTYASVNVETSGEATCEIIPKNNIKSIVTKEQFEQAKYKVGE